MTIRLKSADQVKLLCADDIYAIMQRILLRENRIDRNREHLWTICVDAAHKILNIELVSMGSVSKTIVEPMEVFSIPLQKRAVKIILIHNHPSGELQPSVADKDMTDRLIQCGLIMNIPVLDHVIISEMAYYSFAESGLLGELEGSMKYVPEYKIKDELRKEAEEKANQVVGEKKALEIARIMKVNGEPIEKIMAYTGLNQKIIGNINT